MGVKAGGVFEGCVALTFLDRYLTYSKMPGITHSLRRECSLQARGQAFRDMTNLVEGGSLRADWPGSEKWVGEPPGTRGERTRWKGLTSGREAAGKGLGCERDQVSGLFMSGASEDCEEIEIPRK